MPFEKKSKYDKDKKDRRKLERMSRFFKLKEKISKQRFLKLTTLFMFLLVFIFTTVIIIVFVTTGGMEPASLVSGFFDFVKWEFAGLSLIKVSENLGIMKSKGDKLNDVIEDGANILDGTAQLMRDTSNLADMTILDNYDDNDIVG